MDEQASAGRRGLPPLWSEVALEACEEVQAILRTILGALGKLHPRPTALLVKVGAALDAAVYATELVEGVVIMDRMEAQRRRFGPVADYNPKLHPRVMMYVRKQQNARVRLTRPELPALEPMHTNGHTP
jgi:hypothetical protein